jgi:hypothetical protein
MNVPCRFCGAKHWLAEKVERLNSSPFSLTVAIVARSFSPLYHPPPHPFVRFSQIKLRKQDTFAGTSANTTAPLLSPLFALTRTMSTSMATVHGCGKLATRFTTPQELSFRLMASNHHMHNSIFMTPTMLSTIGKGKILTFTEKYLTSFNNLSITATLSLAYFLTCTTFSDNNTLVILPFVLLPILKRTSVDTTPQLSTKLLW